MLKTALLALALLAVPASAQAATREPLTQAAMPEALPLAQAAYPRSPCAGRLEVEIVPDLRTAGYSDALEAVAPGSPIGGQYLGDCRVQMDAGQEPMEACDELAGHEAGHAANLPHTLTGPMSIGGAPWPPCHADARLVRLAREAVGFDLEPDAAWCDASTRGPAVRCRTHGQLCLIPFRGLDYAGGEWCRSLKRRHRG